MSRVDKARRHMSHVHGSLPRVKWKKQKLSSGSRDEGDEEGRGGSQRRNLRLICVRVQNVTPKHAILAY